MTKVVLWSSSAGDIPANLAFTNNFAATTNPGATNDSAHGYTVGSVWINTSAGTIYVCVDATAGAAVWSLAGKSGLSPTELALLDGAIAGTTVAGKAVAVDSNKHTDVLGLPVSGLKIGVSGSEVVVARTGTEINLLAQGVAAGYKIARGVHQQAAASDTVVTGLATVVAVIAQWRDTPTLKQMFVTATIGDQSGAPAAGSVLIKTFKPTAANDVTPIAASDFTDNLSINWIAIGT